MSTILQAEKTGFIAEFEDGTGFVIPDDDPDASLVFFADPDVAKSDWLGQEDPRPSQRVSFLLDRFGQIIAVKPA